MTYSRPTTDTVDAFGRIGSPMEITRAGVKPRSQVSKPGAVVDARNPAQIGRNAELRTKSIENFVSFLTKDVAPVANNQLQAQGKAAAMDAITSIPGMADGSFYRQSDEKQKKILKDYNLNGYARDQLQNYGAGVAVGQYRQELSNALLASPILQSDAPQEERDREKQRIITETRSILQDVDPRYLVPYAVNLGQFEGSLIGKTEELARDARNDNLKNRAIANFSTWWGGTAGMLLQYGENMTPENVAEYAEQLSNQLKGNLAESLPTNTAKEWYEMAEKGFFSTLAEAIGDEEAEKAETLIEAWEIVNSTPIMSNGHNVWNFANKAGEDGQTASERLARYKEIVDRLVDDKAEEMVLNANSADIGKVIAGDMQAYDRVNNQIIALMRDGKAKLAQALSEALTTEMSNADRRLQEDVVELGRLTALRRDPRVTDEEFAQEVQSSIASRSIRSGTGAQLVRSRYSPSELERKQDAAIEYQEQKTVGEVSYNSDGEAEFQFGENEDVNKVITSALEEESDVEGYLTGQFFGDLEVAVRSKFKEGEPIPAGQELADIIETESIRLVKEATNAIRAEAKKGRKGKVERASKVLKPIYDAIEEGVSREKIWGEEIINYARNSRSRPEQVWKARYAEALLGLQVPGEKRGVVYDKKGARKEAREELERIRKAFKSQQQGDQPNRFAPTSSSAGPIPLTTEIAYETALPSFEEELQTASKAPDQDGPEGLLATGGAKVLEALGRVLPGGGSPAVAGDLKSEVKKAEAIQNSSWKTLNRMFARRQKVSSTTEPLPQLPPTALTDTVSIAMTSDRHPFAVHIGIAEGTRTLRGGYTRAYKGHIDPGDGHRNRGTFSGGRGMGNASPQQVDAFWLRELTARSARMAPVMARAGLSPGTMGYNRLMFNYLDLSVQAAPQAAETFAGKISQMKAGNWSIEVIAKARADSFYNPVTGRLEASGFGNNYSALLADQRSRAGVWDYKRRT